MTTISLGKIAFTWRSTYNASTTYMKQDVVSYNGDSFVCVLDNTMGVTPTDASAAWDLFAQGTTGISNSSGQIIYNNGSGLVALPAGALGQVLTVGPTGLPVWATPEIRSGTKALRFPENTANTQSNLYRTMGVIMTDGSVRAWGQNSNFRIGDGTEYSRSYPARAAFPPGFPGASKLYYTAQTHTYCIDNNGQLWIWGYNDYGQCANGNTAVQRVPFNASADSANSIYGKTVTQVALACGEQNANSSLVLCSDGTVHSCGYNGYGQLGHGDTTYRSRFVQLPVLSGITQIAAGREAYQSCYAVKNDGTLYSWGYNGDGQLGDGTTTNSTISMPRSGGSLSGKAVVKVFAGQNYAMALDSLGNLHAWGTNAYGQLGNGNYALQLTPVLAVGTGVTDAYLGGYDYPVAYIKKTDKTLWACGYGDYWANGVSPAGTTSATFTQIPLGGTLVKAIRGGSGSYNFGAALLTNGQVRVWGYNGNGALGVGDTNNRSSVNTMLTGNRLVTDICALGTSSQQGIALLMDDGQVWQTGYAGGSQLPEDDSESTWTPMPVVF